LSYRPHSDFLTPSDQTVVWRYMDFPKFIHLLETSTLWFCRLDVLEDPAEASFTDAEVLRLTHEEERESERHLGPILLNVPALMRVTTFVNCWRAGRDESMAMWDLYGRASGSIAVKSTIGHLKHAVESLSDEVYVGEVRYVDPEAICFNGNALAMCVRKSLSYRHETEVRMLIWRPGIAPASLASQRTPASWRAALDELKPTIPPGIPVRINLAATIAEVVVGPREPEWLRNMVPDLLKRYDLRQKVSFSTLLQRRA